ncbi:MAG: stage V sporulation protein AC [Oscillospiraceae bacterium]|nr:stage V sporulation protein AC [Oscillospiraceae bacterium]MBR4656858.1 stage V sporulation protein AC [Oscillospiraceae bacterium]
MELSNAGYQQLANRLAPRSHTPLNCLKAFSVGGGICVLGQAIKNLYLSLGTGTEPAGLLCSVTLIFLSALLTGLGLYDDLAKHGGAGTLVPITGFANAVAAPAVEFQTEGWVTGMAVKMFTIAGPVIVYGTLASVVYGLVYWIFTR